MPDSLFDPVDDPALTYAGTSGWSGTDTSRARVERDDRSGRTAAIQSAVLRRIIASGFYGMTVAELRESLSGVAHHGQVSSALTNLHRSGEIERLTERRLRCKVYVVPNCVAQRPTESPRQNSPKTCPHCGESLDATA